MAGAYDDEPRGNKKTRPQSRDGIWIRKLPRYHPNCPALGARPLDAVTVRAVWPYWASPLPLLPVWLQMQQGRSGQQLQGEFGDLHAPDFHHRPALLTAPIPYYSPSTLLIDPSVVKTVA